MRGGGNRSAGGGRSPGDLYRDSRCAEGYDEDRYGGPFGVWLRDHEAALFLDLIGGCGGPILDAGAGTGKLTLALRRAGRRVVACDFSAAMIDVARRETAAAGLEGPVVLGDLQALGFRDGAFEAAVSSRVLMHLPEWREGIAALCRVARRRVVLDFPRSCSFAGAEVLWRRLFRRPGRGARRGYRTFTLRAVSAEIARRGFAVTAVRRGFLLPLALHRIVGRPGLTTGIERAAETIGLTFLFGGPVTIRADRNR